jgi:hypothetical protein
MLNKQGGESDGGKGDGTRPTNKQLYDENYDKIFGKKKMPLESLSTESQGASNLGEIEQGTRS